MQCSPGPASSVRRITCLILLPVLWLLALNSRAVEAPCGDACANQGPWYEFNVFSVKVSSPSESTAGKAYGSWHGEFGKDTRDIRIDAEIFDGNKTAYGQILMIGGRILATKGDITTPGLELDALDGALLHLMLVQRLLGAVLPNGAVDLKGRHVIDHAEEKSAIDLATPGAAGRIAPPWRVKGGAQLVAPDVVDYELEVESGPHAPGGTQEQVKIARLTGRLSKSTNALFDDAMPLQSWTLFVVGPQVQKTPAGTIYDYGAAPATQAYKTIADVRRKLALDDYPGTRDASKDFTGFWREQCDGTFGLQVMRFGASGMYSIVFCGPDGCGDPTLSHKSFITGDRAYEVVSEDQFVQVSESGDRQTYHRCTRDPHPWIKQGREDRN